MEVRVLALVNNHYLISQLDEVASADIGEPDCKLVKPFIVNTESGKTILEPFMLDLTREEIFICLLYTSPSPRDVEESRMPSSA